MRKIILGLVIASLLFFLKSPAVLAASNFIFDPANSLTGSNFASLWKMDDPTGPNCGSPYTIDSGPAGDNAGSMCGSGGYSLNGTATSGKLNVARYLSGGSTYIPMTCLTNDYITGHCWGTGWTMSAWVKPGALPQDGVILANGAQNDWCQNGCGGEVGFSIGNGTNPGAGQTGNLLTIYFIGNGWGFPVCYQGTCQGSWAFSGGYTFTDTITWHHVAMTNDGQYTRVYVDGNQTAAYAISPSQMNYNGRIGDRHWADGWNNQYESQFYNGSVDEVATWWRALSAQEIRYLYNAGNGNPFDTLVSPTVSNVAISNSTVLPNGQNQYTITVAGQSTTGSSPWNMGGYNIGSLYGLINYQNTNAGKYRGYVGWSIQGFPAASIAVWNNSFAQGQIPCSGGGFGAVNDGFGSQYLNLLSCSTNISNNTQTATFTVTFNPSFVSPTSSNVISGFASAFSPPTTYNSGWQSTFTGNPNVFSLNTNGLIYAPPSSLVSWWNMNEATGSAVADSWGTNFGTASPNAGANTLVQSFNNTSLNNGLVSYWGLNDASVSATITDSAPAGNNNGTPIGTTMQPSWNSKNINARSFNGTTDYISIPDNSNLAPGTQTISAWVKPTTFTPGAAIYNRKVPNSGLVSYWKMDEPSGTMVADYLGANNGTTLSCTFSNPSSLNTNLASFWNMDETSGQTVADGLNANNGTATGTTITTGEINNGRSLTGGTDVITSPLVSTATKNYTMAIWVYWRGQSNGAIIYNNGQTGAYSTSGGYGLMVGNGSCGAGNTINVIMSYVTCNAVNAAPTLPTNSWTHITLTSDSAGTLTLYVNGVPKGTGTAAPRVPNGSYTYIGNSEVGTGGFNGIVDETGFWNRALSASEVSNLYNSGSGQSCAPSPLVTTGKINNARSFNGSSDNIAVGNGNSFSFGKTSPFSIGVWIKTTDATNYQYIFGKFDPSNTSGGYGIRIDPNSKNGNHSFGFVMTGGNFYCGNPCYIWVRGYQHNITDGNWHYVVATYSGSNSSSGVSLYVDGAPEASEDASNGWLQVYASPTNSTIPTIGLGQAGYYFHGTIDEVGVWNRVLTAAEISTMYNNGNGLQPTILGIGGSTLEIADTAGHFTCGAYMNNQWYQAISATTLALNTWNHVGCTYNGTNLISYLNGSSVGTTAVSGSINNPGSSTIDIGLNPASNSYYNGTIDEMSLWNRALSSTEIAQLATGDFLHPTRTSSSVAAGAFSSSWAPGLTVLGNARIFNGTSDYVSVPASSSLNTPTGLTISSWIKPSGSASQPIVGYNTGNGSTSANAGASCSSLKLDGVTTSGTYWVVSNGTPTQVYCDMTSDTYGLTRLNGNISNSTKPFDGNQNIVTNAVAGGCGSPGTAYTISNISVPWTDYSVQFVRTTTVMQCSSIGGSGTSSYWTGSSWTPWSDCVWNSRPWANSNSTDFTGLAYTWKLVGSRPATNQISFQNQCTYGDDTGSFTSTIYVKDSAAVLDAPGVNLWQSPTFSQITANFWDTTGTNHSLTSPTNAITAGAWNYVAATYDKASGIGTLYVNGNPVAGPSSLGSFTPQTTYNLSMGARPGNSYYNGTIDEVRVFNTALTPTQILAEYQRTGMAGTCGACSGASCGIGTQNCTDTYCTPVSQSCTAPGPGSGGTFLGTIMNTPINGYANGTNPSVSTVKVCAMATSTSVQNLIGQTFCTGDSSQLPSSASAYTLYVPGPATYNVTATTAANIPSPYVVQPSGGASVSTTCGASASGPTFWYLSDAGNVSGQTIQSGSSNKISQGGSPIPTGYNLNGYTNAAPLTNVNYTYFSNTVLKNAGTSANTLQGLTTCSAPGGAGIVAYSYPVSTPLYDFYCYGGNGVTLDAQLQAVKSKGNSRTSVLYPYNVASADQTITSSLTVANNTNILVFVDGSLNVDTTTGTPVGISVPNANTNATIFFILSANGTGGNIKINPDPPASPPNPTPTTQLDGFYIFPGTFSDTPNNTGTTLFGNGSLINTGSQAWQMLRPVNYTTGNPAESWTYQPKYLWIYNNLLSLSKYSWQELPPQ